MAEMPVEPQARKKWETLPLNSEGEDMTCSIVRTMAGALAHRSSVANYLDNKDYDGKREFHCRHVNKPF